MLHYQALSALVCASLLLGASAWAGSEPVADAPSAPERAPHPEPRVIVSVESVRGPHVRADVERAARLAWGRIVRCYKASEKRPRGAVELELAVAGSGKVSSARRKKSSLGDKQLARCLTKALQGVAMPKARRRSIALVEIRVAPGDS